MATTLYYIADFCDEIVPCDCTLAGWATWLAQPAPEWGLHAAANDGDAYVAVPMRYDSDIIATRTADGWSFDREVDDADLLAVRFGAGLGWSPDNIVGDMAELREFFGHEDDSRIGETEYVAVGYNEPRVRLLFKADPPRLVVEGTVQ